MSRRFCPGIALPIEARCRAVLAAGLLLLVPAAVQGQPAPDAPSPARHGPLLLTPPVFDTPESAGPTETAAPPAAGFPPVPAGTAAPASPGPVTPAAILPAPAALPPEDPVAPLPGAAPAIQMTVLGAPDPASVGLLETAGPLGEDLWRGLDRAFVAGVVQRLPAPVASPTLRGLVRRLLVTQSEIPAAQPNAYDLLQAKLDRLYAAGDAGDLAAMAAIAPVGQGTPDSLRARLLDGLIVAAPDTRLCPLARQWAGHGDDRALAVDVVCRALGADAEGARLGLALLAEHNAVSPAFGLLVGAALGADRPKVAAIPGDDLLLIFLATRLNIALSPETMAAAPLLAAPLLVAAKGPADLRAQAMERAAAAGVLDGDTLAGLYRTISSTPPAARPPGAVAARAAAWKEFDEASGPAVRAQAMVAFAAAARAAVGTAAAAETVANALGSLSDAGLPPALAARLVRLALAADDEDAAMAQYAQLRRRPTAPDLSRLWPYEAVSLNPLGGLPEGAADFARSIGTAPPAARQKALTAAVLHGLGLPVPAALDSGVGAVDPFALPSGLVGRLDDALAAGRQGEALGIAVAMLGAGPLGEVDPAVLAKALATLKAIGLDSQARRLAVEVLLDAGL